MLRKGKFKEMARWLQFTGRKSMLTPHKQSATALSQFHKFKKLQKFHK